MVVVGLDTNQDSLFSEGRLDPLLELDGTGSEVLGINRVESMPELGDHKHHLQREQGDRADKGDVTRGARF